MFAIITALVRILLAMGATRAISDRLDIYFVNGKAVIPTELSAKTRFYLLTILGVLVMIYTVVWVIRFVVRVMRYIKRAIFG